VMALATAYIVVAVSEMLPVSLQMLDSWREVMQQSLGIHALIPG
jgi:hypothetical protein